MHIWNRKASRLDNDERRRHSDERLCSAAADSAGGGERLHDQLRLDTTAPPVHAQLIRDGDPGAALRHALCATEVDGGVGRSAFRGLEAVARVALADILEDYLAYEDRWAQQSGYLIRNTK